MIRESSALRIRARRGTGLVLDRERRLLCDKESGGQEGREARGARGNEGEGRGGRGKARGNR